MVELIGTARRLYLYRGVCDMRWYFDRAGRDGPFRVARRPFERRPVYFSEPSSMPLGSAARRFTGIGINSPRRRSAISAPRGGSRQQDAICLNNRSVIPAPRLPIIPDIVEPRSLFLSEG